jgi:hypothetical protein
MWLNDHIADIYADAESDPIIRRVRRCEFSHTALKLNGSSNRLHRTRKLCH